MEVKEAYLALYELVGAKKEDHFVFTSSGAEAVNHVVFAAYLDIMRKTGRNHFVSGSLDEAPAIMAMSRLSEVGCHFDMASANQKGVITPQSIAETINPRTALVSLSWANALTGVLQPIEEIAELCRERGILFHVEATHVLGKGYSTFEASGADLLTFDGVPGTGGLFIREGVELSPFILGGNEQAAMRAGDFNLKVLIEMGHVAKETMRFRDHLCMETARLRDRFEEILGQGLFMDQERVPHISAQIFPGVASDALLYLLRRKGVKQASFGGNRYQHMKHLLEACGFNGKEAHCGLSFAFSLETTEEEVERVAEKTQEMTHKLQGYSKRLWKVEA